MARIRFLGHKRLKAGVGVLEICSGQAQKEVQAGVASKGKSGRTELKDRASRAGKATMICIHLQAAGVAEQVKRVKMVQN